MAVNSVRSDASSVHVRGIADGSLDALTPAVDPASSEDVAVIAPHASPEWLKVPVQRPRALRDSPPIAPPPPLPTFDNALEDNALEEDDLFVSGGARLPSTEATVHWNPDDARMPAQHSVVVARAYWNPDSATLPRAPKRPRRATWNPDDARLPSS